MDTLRERLAAVGGALAFVAILLIVLPMFDLAASVWPLRPGSLHWRFGASGLLSGFLLTPLLGLTLLTAVATLSNRAVTFLTLALVNGLGTLALAALLTLFALDVLQLRGSIPPAEKAMFDASAVKAVVKDFAGVLALLGLTASNLRLWRSARRARVRNPVRPVLVVAPPEPLEARASR